MRTASLDGLLPGSPRRLRRALVDPALPRPTNVLEISFDDSDDIVEVVCHAVVLAASGSPILSRLVYDVDQQNLPTPCVSASPDSHPRQQITLPVIPLRLPRISSWQPLHDWLYERSSTKLRLDLVGTDTEVLAPVGAEKAVLAGRRTLIGRLDGIRQLWLNVVGLELKDPELERVMAEAWTSLHDALVS